MMMQSTTGGVTVTDKQEETCKLCGRPHPQYACVDGGKICKDCLDYARYERDKRRQAA